MLRTMVSAAPEAASQQPRARDATVEDPSHAASVREVRKKPSECQDDDEEVQHEQACTRRKKPEKSAEDCADVEADFDDPGNVQLDVPSDSVPAGKKQRKPSRTTHALPDPDEAHAVELDDVAELEHAPDFVPLRKKRKESR